MNGKDRVIAEMIRMAYRDKAIMSGHILGEDIELDEAKKYPGLKWADMVIKHVGGGTKILKNIHRYAQKIDKNMARDLSTAISLADEVEARLKDKRRGVKESVEMDEGVLPDNPDAFKARIFKARKLLGKGYVLLNANATGAEMKGLDDKLDRALSILLDVETNIDRGMYGEDVELDEGRLSPGKVDLGNSVYTKKEKPPKFNVAITPLSDGGAAGAALLRRRLPDWSKADHQNAISKLKRMKNGAKKKYDDALDAAAQETWGRPWEITDYRVSGIGSSEFSSKRKDELRTLNKEINDISGALGSHEYVVKHFRLNEDVELDEASYEATYEAFEKKMSAQIKAVYDELIDLVNLMMKATTIGYEMGKYTNPKSTRRLLNMAGEFKKDYQSMG